MAAPLEYIIVGFPESNFSGEIATELGALVDGGLIHIVDLVFVATGDDGSVLTLEVDEHDNLSAFAALEGGVGGVISSEDIAHAAEDLADGSAVMLMVFEDLWAESFADALRRAGGEFVEGARIPAEIAREIEPILTDAS